MGCAEPFVKTKALLGEQGHVAASAFYALKGAEGHRVDNLANFLITNGLQRAITHF